MVGLTLRVATMPQSSCCAHSTLSMMVVVLFVLPLFPAILLYLGQRSSSSSTMGNCQCCIHIICTRLLRSHLIHCWYIANTQQRGGGRKRALALLVVEEKNQEQSQKAYFTVIFIALLRCPQFILSFRSLPYRIYPLPPGSNIQKIRQQKYSRLSHFIALSSMLYFFALDLMEEYLIVVS